MHTAFRLSWTTPLPLLLTAVRIEWGADIVTHSTTKYMDGHAACVGGAIVDSGNFDWEAHEEKFPGLTTPDETYHGIVYTQKFGKGALCSKGDSTAHEGFGLYPVARRMRSFLNIGLETLHSAYAPPL